MPATPGTRAWPPSMPSVPTSRATRVTSSAKEESWSTIVLTVLLSSRISPRASTVILRVRSPLATAVVTSAMLRTCAVRFAAITLTFSVRSFQVPETSWHVGLAAQSALGADLAGHAGDLVGEGRELVDHRVDGALELEDLAAGLDGDLAGQVAAGDGGGDLGDVAHLRGERARHEVHRVGEVAPGAGHAGHGRLAAEPALAAHLAGHAGDLVGERRELVDHGVDGRLQLGQLAARRRR